MMIEKITLKCPFCNSPKIGNSFFENTIFNKKTFRYVRCKNCRIVFVTPPPSQEDYLKMYPPEYQGDIRPLPNGTHNTIFRLIKEHTSGRKILDFGCGNGQLLVNALQNDFVCEGVEFNPNVVKKLNSQIKNANFFTNDSFLRDNTNSYDIVFLSNVLEHIANPGVLIQTLKSRLVDTGLLVLEGPLEINFSLAAKIRSIFFALRKTAINNYASHPPLHLTYCNADGLQKFLNHQGFKTKYFELTEKAWPFPGTITDARTLKQKLLFMTAQGSILLSYLNSDWGNYFYYIGKKN